MLAIKEYNREINHCLSLSDWTARSYAGSIDQEHEKKRSASMKDR
jgi:hypothetical protein